MSRAGDGILTSLNHERVSESVTGYSIPLYLPVPTEFFCYIPYSSHIVLQLEKRGEGALLETVMSQIR
jgi:hypothetical protein